MLSRVSYYGRCSGFLSLWKGFTSALPRAVQRIKDTPQRCPLCASQRSLFEDPAKLHVDVAC